VLVPLSWLRDFAPFDLDPAELGEVFDDLGMVVESLTRIGEGLEDVVVARVLAIEAIPGADKIRKVIVDAGGEPVQIVCGAWNFAAGDSVPLAPVGAVLPGGFEIGRRKMKGVASEGMLCSARELGLGDDTAGLLVLGADAAAPGTPIVDALGIERDVVYDLAIEANRPDANCIAGVARDAAARLGLPFALPEPRELPGSQRAGRDTTFTVTVTAPDLCDRFTATVFDGVVVAPSPGWVARRLTLAGMRPISNAVDASNYVMLELGQPTHAYDLDRLPSPALGARAAHPGERLTTLDDITRTLGLGAQPDCVIVDGDDVAIGIAGIMGGASSEVHAGTTRIALEAAHFVPMAIARSSKRLGLRSEASARFERGVDIGGIEGSIRRFAEVLAETSPQLRACGAPVDWSAPGSLDRRSVRVRIGRVNAVLGTDLGPPDLRRLLEPIGFVVGAESDAESDVALDVLAPTFRPDVEAEIDVVEEVARHHGYARIARTTVRPTQVGRLTSLQRARRDVRDLLRGAGLSEAAGGPLLAPGDHSRAGLAESVIAAVDPLAREESVLRASLRPGLLRAAAFNHDRRNGDLGLFEIGGVWSVGEGKAASGPDVAPGRGLPVEHEVCAGILAGMGAAGTGGDGPAAVRVVRRLAAGLHLDGVVLEAAETPGLHPTRTAAVVVGGAPIGWVGEIDPAVVAAWGLEGRVGWFEVDLPTLVSGPRAHEQARPVTKFPSSDVDLAFAVPEGVAADAVRRTLEVAGRPLLESVTLFDVYRGVGVPPGARSLAFRLRFSSLDHTLTDAEVGEARRGCIVAVETAHGASLRG